MNKTVELDEVLALKIKLLQQELAYMQLAQQLKQKEIQELSNQLVREYEEEGKYKLVSVDLNKLEVVLCKADEDVQG